MLNAFVNGIVFLTLVSSLSVSVSVATNYIRSALPSLWPAILTYMIWALLFDKAPDQGGRPSEWVRALKCWNWFAGYYPAS